MEPADTLCASLFRWLENREKCAGELEKLAQELEDVPEARNVTQSLRDVTSVASISRRAASLPAIIGSLASDSKAKEAVVSRSTFDKATEFIKEDEEVGTSIQEQLRDLKVRCAETQKVRCAETLKVRCAETQKVRCAETQKVRCAETQKVRCAETQKVRCAETQKVRCAETQKVRCAETQKVRCAETQKVRCAETQKVRCAETQKVRCAETQKVRCAETQKDRCGEKLKDRCGETLKDRCGETLKDRCVEAPLGTHADELDCEVTTLLMCALARRSNTPVPLDFLRGFNRATFFRHMTPGGLDPAEATDFICQALGLDRSPEITSGLKVSGKEMVKNIELIGTKAAEPGSEALGVIGLGISLCDLLEKSEKIVQGNQVMKACKFLRDSARGILDGRQELKEQLDAMHEIIQKLFIMKRIIKNLGGYSLSMDANVQNIMNFIKATCTDDTVVSWLQGLPHQIEFVNLVRFFLERLDHIPEYLTKSVGDHIHIVIVSHGGIVDQYMPAGGLVPTDNIRDTILYSPWNCRIDPKAAFAIAQGSIQPADRAFFNIAHCEPIPLPDHWNHMKTSQESRHNIPVILLSPVTPADGAWEHFLQLWENRGLEINNRVIIPYLVPKDQENAFGQIPLYMFIFAISFLLMLSNKTATVHLAACLSRVQCVRQYAYTSDNMYMTVRIDEQDMNSELYRAFRSLFDTTNTGLESDPEQFNA